MRRGLNIVGFVRAELGIGEAARLLVAAAKMADIPYAVVPVEKFVPSRQAHHLSDVGTGDPSYDVNVIVLNPPELIGFVGDGGMARLKGRYTIGNWWWEVTTFPESMRGADHLVDEVWVGSTHVAESIAPTLLKPVLTLRPPIIRPNVRRIDPARFGVPHHSFFFLFTFDFHSTFQRKNPLAVINAFKAAFPNGDGPHLVIKSINGASRPQQLAELGEAVGHRADIHIHDGYLAAEEQHGLIASCSAYVSLHRAEGFGLTMAEAMAHAKPVIATGYSGNLDFMHAGNSHLVPYEMTPIPPGCAPYPEGGEWADPDVEAAASLMRQVYDQPDAAREIGERARADIERLHSPEARAEFLTTRLDAIERALRHSPGTSPLAPGRRAHSVSRRLSNLILATWRRFPERGKALLRPLLTALHLRGYQRADRSG